MALEGVCGAGDVFVPRHMYTRTQFTHARLARQTEVGRQHGVDVCSHARFRLNVWMAR